MIRVEIKPELLRWARERAGYDAGRAGAPLPKARRLGTRHGEADALSRLKTSLAPRTQVSSEQTLSNRSGSECAGCGLVNRQHVANESKRFDRWSGFDRSRPTALLLFYI